MVFLTRYVIALLTVPLIIYGFDSNFTSDDTFVVSPTQVPLVRLTKDILNPDRYDTRVRPMKNHTTSLKIHISMSLYQIIEVNEPSQNIKMNVWMIQKWVDEMLDWDPHEYNMINTTILPHNVVWIPDTYLYNSVVMSRDETERYMNVRADTRYWQGKKGAEMSFLYPAIYTITCRLNIRYFPYDQQNCTLTISSWTNSKSALDYYGDEEVNLQSYIPNEEWDVISFRVYRHEYKYACCPEPWVILEASIVIRRKPLYYVVNLIIPTSIITIVAITGFFTPASTSDDRTEKINLGITTLLAMSILMLMVSDQMPTTSEFVPLIAWFYLSIIIIVSIGTFLTSIVLSIQGRRQYGRIPPLVVRYLFFVQFIKWVCLSVPPQLLKIWEELDDHPYDCWIRKRKGVKNGQLVETNGAARKRSVASEKRNSCTREEQKDMGETLISPAAEPDLLHPKRPSKRAMWLRASQRASTMRPTIEEKASLPMIDISTPTSPSSPDSGKSRRPSKISMWDNAMMLVGLGDRGMTVKKF
uniref:Acetylcholine receptor subunit alpha-type deg-3 n=1 Tax=Steinernema glaseri TaxID=37863 RepID=A0A1I7XWL0_9BILA